MFALNALGNVVLRLLGVNRRRKTRTSTTPPRNCSWSCRRAKILAPSGPSRARCCRICSSSAISPQEKRWCRAYGSSASRSARRLTRSGSCWDARPHTRYPVYERDLDHIIGMVHIKDLLRVLLRDESIRRTHARPLPLVPETAPLDSVLSTMRTERTRTSVPCASSTAPIEAPCPARAAAGAHGSGKSCYAERDTQQVLDVHHANNVIEFSLVNRIAVSGASRVA